VLVNQDIDHSVLSIESEDTYEMITLRCKFNETTFTAVFVYVWGTCTITQVRAMENKLSVLPEPIILMGDLNSHHEAWGDSRDDYRGKAFIEVFDNLDMTILNDGSPTFIRPPEYTLCLDVTACTSSFALMCDWSVDNTTRGSDHYPTYVTIRSTDGSKNRRFSVTNWNLYRQLVKAGSLQCDSVDDLAAVIRGAKTLATCQVKAPANKCAPTMETKRLLAVRLRAQRRARRTKSHEDWRKSQKANDDLRHHYRELEEARLRERCQQISTCRSSLVAMQAAKSMMGSVAPKRPFFGVILADSEPPEAVLNRFTEHVLRPAELVNPQLFEEYKAEARERIEHYQPNGHPEMDHPFTATELDHAIRTRKSNSAPGPDGISYQDIASMEATGKLKLLELFNRLYKAGEFPCQWKVGQISPLPKPGKDRTKLENYRPIALSSCVGKVFESLLKSRLTWFLEGNSIFNETMAGFRAGRSVHDNLHELISDLEQSKADGLCSGMVLFDLARAFDTVPHIVLQDAFVKATVPRQMYDILMSYLTDRRVRTKVGQHEGSYHAVRQGVPQGGVLSPLLFNMVMGDLAGLLQRDTNLSIFADDTAIWAHNKRPNAYLTRKLERGAEIVFDFASSRGLSLSVEKTSTMFFTQSQRVPPVELNGKELAVLTSTRFLGVTLDNRLSWTPQRRILQSSSVLATNVLRTLTSRVSAEKLLQIAEAFNGNRLLYFARHTNSRAVVDRMDIIRRRDLRLALGLLPSTRNTSVLAEAGKPPFVLQIKRTICRYLIKLRSRFPEHPLLTNLASRPASRAGEMFHMIRELASQMPSITRPLLPFWIFPENKIILEVKGLAVKKGNLDEHSIQQLFAAHMEHMWCGFECLYSDGSVTAEGSSGAVWRASTGEGVLVRLAFKSSSTTAELLAIREALRMCEGIVSRKVVIISDSKAALQSLGIPDVEGCCHPQLLHDIQTSRVRLGPEVGFQWCPSHCGITGNTMADSLAKQAQHAGILCDEVKPSANELLIEMDLQLREEWRAW
jgi:ribonuclease HI